MILTSTYYTISHQLFLARFVPLAEISASRNRINSYQWNPLVDFKICLFQEDFSASGNLSPFHQQTFAPKLKFCQQNAFCQQEGEFFAFCQQKNEISASFCQQKLFAFCQQKNQISASRKKNILLVAMTTFYQQKRNNRCVIVRILK